MLSPEIIKKIKKVHIKTSRIVNTMMAGQYRSVFRGSGIEFEEVREYSPGDEVKSIDWKVSARLGRPFVKLYREERELVVMLLVDMSASGRFGTGENLKIETAAEIASILAFNAIRNNDKVGAILFTDRVEKYIPPKKGSSHVWRVIKEMFTFTPEHKGTDIQNAISYLGRVCRKRSVCFLISDFLSQDYLSHLRSASRKHEMISVILSDPGDFTLPEAGIFLAEDFETGEQLYLDASDKKTRQRFENQKSLEHRNTLNTLKSADIDCVEVDTEASVADALIRYFRYREKRKR
ncbi:MAG: DUF58 domain-containing protein [Desulfobacteraceae bacterium 4572_88]|nr:MAG: DUF58 domain-containing protein [Desulfobacteraceae bacterium 4572_88]RLC06290.1 MAG: DUF58 domain-containing protein [Deltaproteobacteria bacterium]